MWAVEGEDAASELARLDQTKKELDSIAKTARRAGDNNQSGDQAEALAQEAARADGRVASPGRNTKRLAVLPGRASRARRRSRPGPTSPPATSASTSRARREPSRRPRTGWPCGRPTRRRRRSGCKISQAGPAHIAPMTTPAGQEAIAAVFGKRGGRITDRLETEKMFNTSERGITGNPTTAQQLADIAGGAIGTGAVSHLLGFDPFQTRQRRRAGRWSRQAGQGRISEAAQNYVTGRNRASAPYLGEALVASPENIPLYSRIQPTPPLSGLDRNALARVMVLMGLPMAGY